jgi:hypothetical protein
MKHTFWAAGMLSASLFVVRVGHATTYGWVPVPGLATQIAVGANDIPYILDINGYVQYLSPPKLACSGTLCTPVDRAWVMMNHQASQIAADQYGYLWAVDSVGGLTVGLPSTIAFDTTMQSTSVGACLSSLAPGRPQPVAVWNYPFGVSAFSFTIPPNAVANMPYTTTYSTGCIGQSLSSIDFTLHVENTSPPHPKWFTSNGWQPVDTGEIQVTQFTVDGSATQVPWVVAHMSDGTGTVWAYDAGSFIGQPPPSITALGLTAQYSVTYATDHYVAAGNAVWRWNGDAHGNRGKPIWTLLAHSTPPSGGAISQIAYGSALPGTQVGTVGPSHLWMVDSNQNIYQYGDISGPVR